MEIIITAGLLYADVTRKNKHVCMFLLYKLSFSVLFSAPLGEIPPVMSHHCCMLVHVVQVAEGCRGLKLPQTVPSTGLLNKQLFFFPPPLAVSGRDTNSCSLAERLLMLAVAAAVAPAPLTPRPSGKTQHDMRLSLQPRALHRHDFLLRSSSASVSTPPTPQYYYFQCLGQ